MLTKIFYLLILLNLNCSGTSHYFTNRYNDFLDMPVIGVEEEVYGGSFQFWCFGGGIQYSIDGTGTGIRNGTVGKYLLSKGNKINFFSKKVKSGFSIILLNAQSHHSNQKENSRAKKKAYHYTSYGLIFPNFSSCHAPLSLEFNLGLYYGFRFGINFSEIGDFVLGVFFIDYMRDDILEKKVERIEEDNYLETEDMDPLQKKELDELKKISEEKRNTNQPN